MIHKCPTPIVLLTILALACGGSGGGITPSDACAEMCERLVECDITYSNTTCAALCSETARFEGTDDACDDAAVDYYLCNAEASCSVLTQEPCPQELSIATSACAGVQHAN